MDLNGFLAPSSIAVVGASSNLEKIGAQIFSNIIKSNYNGNLYPVNNRETLIQGHQAYPALSQIPNSVDLVVIAIPKEVLMPVIDECVQTKAKAVIIISAGFKETGEEGAQLEKELAAKLKSANIPLLGPNCLGLIYPYGNLNASFAAEAPAQGNVMLISQSGAFGTACIDWANNNNIGLSLFLSIGNKAITNENDLLEALTQTQLTHTKVIGLYLEDFADGHKFISIAQKIAQTIPIVILKPGRGVETKKAIQSHTGSLAGDDAVVSHALEKAGCIRANTSEEFFNTIKALSYLPSLKGNQIAIVTNAGGPSIMSTDSLEQTTLKLAPIPDPLQNKLREFLPRAANIKDPIDLIGDAKADRYDNALREVLASDTVHGALVILTPQTSTQIEKTAESVIKYAQKYAKPIITSFMGGSLVHEGIQILTKNHIPAYPYPENAITVFDKINLWNEWKQSIHHRGSHTFSPQPDPIVKEIFSTALSQGRKTLNQHEIETVFNSELGIKFPRKEIIKSSEEAWQQAQSIGLPVVMKVSSDKILHKTEQGGVVVNLTMQQEIKEAYIRISSLLTKVGDSQGHVYIQKQIPKNIEILIGLKRDPSFGPVIVFGTGGIYTEVYKDIAMELAPLSHYEAREMIKKTKIGKVLGGYRNQVFNTDGVIETIIRLSSMSLTYPEIKEVDINPLEMFGDSLVALDARILL